jgi:hypothetical protein
MRIGITGSTGLAAAIAEELLGHDITHVRVEEARLVWEDLAADVFINCAHVEFEQTKLLMQAYEAWKNDSSKYIINISSRAAQPNISKGYMYSAQKASLNHLANNLVYNSDKQCRISTINLGLLNSKFYLPSVSHKEVADIVSYLIKMSEFTDLEYTELTVQNRANYQEVQSDKEALKDLEWLN